MYEVPEDRLRERRGAGGGGINIFPHTYLFYMAKVAALILFFFNKIINELLHI